MDDIKRKLALIDKQLSGGFINSYQRIISTSPLVFAALGLILGILIQNTFFESRVTGDGPQFGWLVLLALCATGAFIFFAIQSISSNNRLPITNHQLPITNYQYATAHLALICFICLGAIRLITFYSPELDDIRNFVGSERELTTDYTDKVENDKLKSVKSVAKKIDESKLATIRGLIVTDPYVNRNENWKFARFKFTDPDTSFYLKLSELKTVDVWSKVSGVVRVQVAEPILDLKSGDYIQAYCWLDRFNPPTNPGQFDIAKYLTRKNVFIAASIKSRDAIEVLKNSSAGAFIKMKRNLQEVARQSLLGDLDVESQNYALLQALVLGYRTEIDSNTYRAFQKTGLLHFICLSGMNFGILIGIIWWLCKTAGLMKPTRAVICLAAAGIFLLVVPPQSPAIRAAIMCFVFCASFFFRRKSNPFNTLSLAAIILLLIRPTYLFEPGWQLSFASVLGILLFTEPIEGFISEKLTALFEDPLTGKLRPYFRIVSQLASPVIAVFSVSFAAWLASSGILLYHFYTIIFLTSIWTVIVSPLIGFISVIGYLKTILALFLPTMAAMLDMVISPLTGLLIWVVKLIAGWDISDVFYVLIGKVSPVMIILYYAFLPIFFFAHFHRPLTKKIICVAMLLAMIVFLGVTKLQRTHRDNLVITCLDVGHGQAILAQLPGSTNVLFDAGSLHNSDIGRRIVAPFLDYIGLSKIDAVIISHNDIDHINGIPEIIEHCDVNDVYANKVFVDKARKGGAAKFLKTELLKKRHKIQRVDKNLDLASAADIKILWPTKQICQNEELDDNDKSMVTLIEFAGRKILLCSDITKFAQMELLQLYPDLNADIVVVPHHGSAKTAEPNFLEKLDADIFICSCGQSQYERYIESQSAGHGSLTNKSFYTPVDGAITIRINKDGTITTDVFAE